MDDIISKIKKKFQTRILEKQCGWNLEKKHVDTKTEEIENKSKPKFELKIFEKNFF